MCRDRYGIVQITLNPLEFLGRAKNMANPAPNAEESSESENENEIEPAKVFHRQLSTHKNVKASVCII